MLKTHEISPSILSVEDENLNSYCREMYDNGIRILHIDVMDGAFVKNTSFTPKKLSKISEEFKFFYDVHLMCFDPVSYAKEYVKAGANLITFHVEALENNDEVLNTIAEIKKLGVKAGISLKPLTPIEKVLPYLHLVDLVLIMSVEPGAGYQKFIESSYERIDEFVKFRVENSLSYLIEIDGGINNETGKKAFEKKTDILVSGSYMYKNGVAKTMKELL